ncbi:MAG: hypothetical protein JOZ72_05785 [Alphaproteobacteria bacterium]|nr:hypothetical protein [Alphaproteobacteria bacterium]
MAGGAVVYGAALLLRYDSAYMLAPSDFMNALPGPFVLWTFFALYPQARFKPEERRLEIGSGGIDTEIRGMHKHYDWRDISAIVSEYGIIEVRTQTGNAFLVPERAFESAHQRDEFLQQARTWSAPT